MKIFPGSPRSGCRTDGSPLVVILGPPVSGWRHTALEGTAAAANTVSLVIPTAVFEWLTLKFLPNDAALAHAGNPWVIAVFTIAYGTVVCWAAASLIRFRAARPEDEAQS